MTRWEQILWCCAEPRDEYAAKLRSGDIAKRLGMVRSNVSRMLTLLRSKGFVSDWRGCEATEAGREYIKNVELRERESGAWVDLPSG